MAGNIEVKLIDMPGFGRSDDSDIKILAEIGYKVDNVSGCNIYPLLSLHADSEEEEIVINPLEEWYAATQRRLETNA